MRTDTPASDNDYALLEIARSLAFVRPLVPYPGWKFDRDWDNPDLAFRLRRSLWSHFRERGADAELEWSWYDGLSVSLRLGNDLSKQLFVGGCSEPNELAFLNEVLKPGMVFIDAGAHEGLFSLFAAKRVGGAGKVYSFEPSEREFGRLLRNLQRNGLKNVSPYRLALADYVGEGDLCVADQEHTGQKTLGRFVHKGVELRRKERIEVCTLDELVRREDIGRVDVLKLDVEGAEGRLLRGAEELLRVMRPTVMFEVLEPALSLQGTGVKDLLGLFSSAGYEIYRFDDATGQPVPCRKEALSDNAIAVPAERPIPGGLYRSLALAADPSRGAGEH